jgi:glycosyltransferase involved in cell wall biosynthesis
MNAATLSPNTGISVQTVQVAEELAARGHRLDLVYVEDGPFRDRYHSISDSMRQVPALDLELRGALRQAPRLVPALRAGAATHPDVIYLNRFKPLPWALATSTFTRAPVVCHLHGLVGIGTPAVNRNLSRFTNRFICVSNFVRDRFVAAGGDPARTDVVHNGIDLAEYPAGGSSEQATARAELGLSEEPFIVLFYGRLSPEKGVDILISAVAGLGGGGRPVEVVLMGPYLEDTYGRDLLASAPGVTIHHLPMRTDVVTPLHAADVVAVPSVCEDAFPRTVLEALSTGRPVIGSSIGGIPEALTGDFARFLVPPGDVGALTATLTEVLDWRRREPGLGQACTDHVARNFSKSGMVDGVEQRLVDAVRRPPRGPGRSET